MKKKILTLLSLVLVMTVSAVMLVSCTTPPAGGDKTPPVITMADIINEDGTVKADKFIGEQVTAEQWNAATSSAILDKDLSFYMKEHSGEQNQVVKTTIDGKKIKQTLNMNDGEIKQTTYMQRLDNSKFNMIIMENDKWISNEHDYNPDGFFDEFQIGQLNKLFVEATYDAESKQYTIKNSETFFPNSTATVKFTEGKLNYFKLEVDGKTFAEVVLLYEDATVTLPVVA